jgi:hypothetical protein
MNVSLAPSSSSPLSTICAMAACTTAVLLLLVACGNDSGGSDPQVCVAHTTPPPAALASPPTSFEADVAPTLGQSCAFSSCHGSRLAAANHGVYLGANADPASVKAALIGQSKALPTMPYVTPGDPDKSFLLHKLDGDLCVLEESCVGGECGDQMPSGNAALPDEKRDAIRRWIAQGAK